MPNLNLTGLTPDQVALIMRMGILPLDGVFSLGTSFPLGPALKAKIVGWASREEFESAYKASGALGDPGKCPLGMLFYRIKVSPK